MSIPSPDVIDEANARTLTWDGCVNVRDLGGIPTEDGGVTRTGRIIRSDNVGALTPAGWRALEDHGVDRIVDLRWPEEQADDPPRDVDVEVVNVSVLGPRLDDALDYLRTLDAHVDAVDDIADHYAFSYVDFLERNQDRFGQALGAVADAAGTVVIHCMGGKDRTGLVAALLLRLAGVALEDIGLDYSLSGPNLIARTRSWLESAPDEPERLRREKLSQTPATAMARVIAEVERRFGSVEGYLAGGGVQADQIERLRARLR
jgi:protein tyrosine/serine phosphatase